MKRRIDYESKTVLPEGIAELFRTAEKNMLKNKDEFDKIILHLQKLKYDSTVWFSNRETILEERHDRD